jgi:hypothetical protein
VKAARYVAVATVLLLFAVVAAVVAWRRSIRIDKHEDKSPQTLLGVVSPNAVAGVFR